MKREAIRGAFSYTLIELCVAFSHIYYFIHYAQVLMKCKQKLVNPFDRKQIEENNNEIRGR